MIIAISYCYCLLLLPIAIAKQRGLGGAQPPPHELGGWNGFWWVLAEDSEICALSRRVETVARAYRRERITSGLHCLEPLHLYAGETIPMCTLGACSNCMSGECSHFVG